MRLENLKLLAGMLLTAASLLIAGAVWKAGVDNDIESLQSANAILKQDHDTVVRMGVDISYIKEALVRIENRVGAKNKEATNGQ